MRRSQLAAALLCTLAAIPAQSIVRTWPTGGQFAGGTAYDPITDELWVIDSSTDTLNRHARTGALIRSLIAPIPPGASLATPIGGVVDPVSGNLWVCDEAEIVYEIDRYGNLLAAWSTRPSISDASAITMDPLARTLFVSNDSSSLVQEFDLLGNTIGTAFSVSAAGSVDADGIAYNPLTRSFYLGEDTGDQIIEVDRTGSFLRAISTANVGGIQISPEGLDLDTRTGSLFIAGGNTPASSARTIFEVSGIVPAPNGSVTTYGAGCPDSGGSLPSFDASVVMQAGASIDLAVQTTARTGPTAILVFVFAGARRASIHLGIVGAPACNVWVAPFATLGPLALNANKRAGITLSVPSTPGIPGITLEFQPIAFPDTVPGSVWTANAIETVAQ